MRKNAVVLYLLLSLSFIFFPSCSKDAQKEVDETEDLIDADGVDYQDLNPFERLLVGTFEEVETNDPDIWCYTFYPNRTGRIFVIEGGESTEVHQIKWAATENQLTLIRLYLDKEKDNVTFDYTLDDGLLTFNGMKYKKRGR